MMSTEDVMASVEKMLLNEKQTLKPKAAAAQEFDLNEGIVQVKTKKKGAMIGKVDEATEEGIAQKRGMETANKSGA